MIAPNEDWQKARKSIGDVEKVLKLVRSERPPSRTALGKSYKLKCWEDRRGKSEGSKNSITGERKTERALLGKTIHLEKCNGIETWIKVVVNAFPLGAVRRSQREVDLVGIDRKGAPVAIEVKETANNAWYATVELCEYVWRMRHDHEGIEKAFQDCLRDNKWHRGTWGLLLAPKTWWENPSKKKAIDPHLKLINELSEKTEIRIVSRCLDELKLS